jgi:hypothetical protein
MIDLVAELDGRPAPGTRTRYRAGAQGDADRRRKAAGWRFLRTQNDLGNLPMRRVNERLGYVKRFE